jgi:hypothetical protein
MAADYVAQLLAFSRRSGACDTAEILRRRAVHARSITEDKIASVRLALEPFVSSPELTLALCAERLRTIAHVLHTHFMKQCVL